MTARIVGLDLSLTATGVARWDSSTFTIRPTSAGDRRLVEIRDSISVECSDCALAVIEDLPTHAKAAGITGMVHGAVRAALLAMEIPYALVTPASLKKYATGRGNATKADMRVALLQRTGVDLRDDNRADAAWLRFMALDAYGEPFIPMPVSHRAALAKVAWPELARVDK